MKYGLAVIGMIALLVGGTLATYAIQWYTAPARGALDAREKIQANGDFRIAAYDHYFNECASIQGIESTIEFSRQQLATVTSQAEQNRIATNLTALQSARAEAIAQYNADSAKSYTQGQFKSSNLPYRIALTPYTGVPTTCTA